MPHLSAVIPLYNEERCLIELYTRLSKVLASLHPDYEIIFVDDGSRDRTWAIVEELAAKDKRVRGIQFSRNFGQHHGITAGLDVCDGDWVVIMDGDLQHRPEEIPKLYARALEGYDVVHARRVKRKHRLSERLASWFFSKLFNYFTGMHRDEQVGAFRMLSRRVVENFRTMREQMRYVAGMLDWMGFPSTTVDVQHDARAAGGSGYSFRKRWRLAEDAIIAYSDKPLHLTVRLGFTIAVFALAYGLYIVIRALLHRVSVAGWASLIVSLFFLSGLIIATLGIVGIYLGRTFAETKRRPLYIVKERVGFGSVETTGRAAGKGAEYES